MREPKPGDFFVVRTHGWVAAVIRFWTNSNYNHAGIYVGDGQVIEADPNGVQYAPLSNYDGYDIEWSDLPLTDEQRAQVVRAAKAMWGLPYGFVDIAEFILRRFHLDPFRWDHKRAVICSQVVAAAYLDGPGIDLCPGKDVWAVSPGDLDDVIHHATVPADY